MAGLKLSGLRKTFGQHEVIRGVDLTIADGEFVVFVGPSGCGKSTLLRMIAGLEEISAGLLEIDGRRANELEPRARGIAMVFQSYALYPHMTVAENMGFGLSLQKRPRAEIRERVGRAARILQMEALLERKPSQLSGGQRQRVAIGRAIVREPAVFLFDEPLSNLDAALRMEMRLELARLHRQLGTTMIYVTHDQVEAMTLADRIVVLQGGVVQQVGAPMEIYRNPANAFVGGFIGSPKMNFLPVEVSRIAAGQAAVAGPGFAGVEVAAGGLTAPGPALLGLRPQFLRPGPGPVTLAGRIAGVERMGTETVVAFDLAAAAGAAPAAAALPAAGTSGQPVLAVVPGDAEFSAGSEVAFSFDPRDARLFPHAPGR